MRVKDGILLCFSSGDPREIDLALDYWGGEYDENHRWNYAHRVRDVAEAHDLPEREVLAKVLAIATAFDLSKRCRSC